MACALVVGVLVAGAGLGRPARDPIARRSYSQRSRPFTMAADHDILLRVSRGEKAERTPVWMMRQAGRYMKAFRAISTKYPFRQRSETPGMLLLVRKSRQISLWLGTMCSTQP